MGSKSWFVDGARVAWRLSAAFVLLVGLPAAGQPGPAEVARPVSPVPPALEGRQPEVLQWLDGTIAYNWHNECITGNVEALTGHYVGYYGETNVTFPRVNDVVGRGFGNPAGVRRCVGQRLRRLRGGRRNTSARSARSRCVHRGSWALSLEMPS